jgi:hypothetical protein
VFDTVPKGAALLLDFDVAGTLVELRDGDDAVLLTAVVQ